MSKFQIGDIITFDTIRFSTVYSSGYMYSLIIKVNKNSVTVQNYFKLKHYSLNKEQVIRVPNYFQLELYCKSFRKE